MLGWAFLWRFSENCHKSKTDWNWTECALFSTVICCLLPLPLWGWIKSKVLKRSALKASYYFLLWSGLIFWKWVSNFLKSLVQTEPFLWALRCKTKKHIASQAKQVCTIEDFLTTGLCQVCSQPCTESCYCSARSYRPKIIIDVYLSQRILSTPKHQGKKIY